MMKSYRVRGAKIEDSTPCAELVTILGYPTRPEQMRERLAQILSLEQSMTLVAEASDGNLLGLVGGTIGRYYEKDGLYARLNILVVSERSHGLGVGSALLTSIEEWAKSQNAQDIVVNSGNHRHGAHRFYESIGYSATGVRLIKSLTG